MAIVYRYLDDDGIPRYVGITKDEDRFKKRIKEHCKDVWICLAANWTVQYITVPTMSDAQMLEGHFICAYKKAGYDCVNKSKSNWGKSSFISDDYAPEWTTYEGAENQVHGDICFESTYEMYKKMREKDDYIPSGGDFEKLIERERVAAARIRYLKPICVREEKMIENIKKAKAILKQVQVDTYKSDAAAAFQVKEDLSYEDFISWCEKEHVCRVVSRKSEFLKLLRSSKTKYFMIRGGKETSESVLAWKIQHIIRDGMR